MSTKSDIAVVGCGGWGRNIVRTMHRLGRLAAVVDPCPERRDEARTLAGSAEVFESPASVLEDDRIRALMIATPAESHYDIACRAIDAGKDVFVEKPLTIDVAEARDLVERANARSRILMVGHLLEYHPAVLTLIDLIRSGELGELRYVISNRLNLGKVRTRENALWSFAPHDLAVILRLVGSPPTEIVATGGTYLTDEIADVTVTQLRFDAGVRAHVFVSWLHPFKEQRLVVIGSKKMASFDDVSKKLVLYDQRIDWHEGEPVPVRDSGAEVPFGATEPLEAECRHFMECVDTRRRPRTDGESGVTVLEILHAAQESLLGHGVRVPFDGASAPEAPVPVITTHAGDTYDTLRSS